MSDTRDDLRASLRRFAQKVERRAVALVRGDDATAALEQTNIDLAVDEIVQTLERDHDEAA